MAFVSYIVKSGIILIVLLIYYEIVLKRQTSFKLNRFYLLGSLLFAAGIPFIHISYPFFKEVSPINILSSPVTNVLIDGEISVIPQTGIGWGQYFIYFYLCGIIIFSIRYFHFWYHIFKLFSILPHKKIRGLHIYLLSSTIPTFSLFHHLFFNPQGLDKKNRRKIFEHEKIHIRQWHSLDIQISEIICIFNWFNPLVWIFKRYIIQNHEYIADQQVVQQFQASGYLQLLVYQALKGNTSFRNYFSCSNLKKRVKMITHAKPEKSKYWNYIPVFLISSVLFFCSTSIAIGTSESPATDLSSSLPVVKDQTAPASLPLQTGETKDTEAVFPPGNVRNWINQHIKYPVEAIEKKLQGTVIVAFTIDEAGKKQNVSISQSLAPSLDAEALRLVQSMPDWKPAVKDGKRVSSSFSIPIHFRLSPAQSSETSVPEKKALSKAEEMPRFGEDVTQWISKHIRYPAEAQVAGYKSKVYVHFIVDKNGDVKEVELTHKSPHEVLNQEAIRVIKSMPRWESPGKVEGKPVNVSYTLPINFFNNSPGYPDGKG